MAHRFRPRLWLYPSGGPGQGMADWGLAEDISAYIRHPGQDGGAPIEYSAGRGDESTRVDPARMTLTLDNRDGRFSTHNPNGTYFGQLTRNTPVAMGVEVVTDTFGRADNASSWGDAEWGGTWTNVSGNWTVSGNKGRTTLATANLTSWQVADLSAVGAHDADILFSATMPVLTLTAPMIVAPVFRYEDTNNAYRIYTEFKPGGVITQKIMKRVDGGNTDLVEELSTGVTYTAGQKIWVRGQCVGSQLRGKLWADGDDEPAEWTVTTEDSELTTGRGLGFMTFRFSGNSNPGALYVEYDDITITALEFVGAVSQWPLRWNKRGTNAWAPIQANGILRRLSQGSVPSKSPLTRNLPTHGPSGYWPLEDGTDSASFASEITGGREAVYSGVSPGVDTSLAGAIRTPTLSSATGWIRGQVVRTSTAGTGFSAMFFCKFASLPGGETTLATVSTTGRVVQWNIRADNTGFILRAYDADGTKVVDDVSLSAIDITQWFAIQVETSTSGSTTTWGMTWHQVGRDSTFWGMGSTFSSSLIHRATGATLGAGTLLSGVSFAHLWLGPDTLPFVTEDSFRAIASGYEGELAADRIARVCEEEGIPVLIEDGDTMPLGAQREGTPLEAIYSAADADFGILYETGVGLGFRPRAARYQQAVDFELVVSSGHLGDAPEPTFDDQRVRNSITVSRTGGSSATLTDDAHILREGLYPDSVTINVETDDLLLSHAGWRLYLGTRPDLRWPGIALNLARSPALIPYWLGRRPFPRITIETGLPQVAGAEPDVIVEGYQATLWPDGWEIRLSASAAAPWDIGTLDDSLLRLPSGGSVLFEDLDTTETVITVFSAEGEARPWWPSTEPGWTGFDIIIGGEVMTVSGVSIAAEAQNLTVTRSVNGVVKEHATGTPVELLHPMILRL